MKEDRIERAAAPGATGYQRPPGPYLARPWLVLLAGAVAALLGLLLAGALRLSGPLALVGPIVATDLSQQRLDTALPAPRGPLALAQSFVAGHDGLSQIELLLVRFQGDGDSDSENKPGRLRLQLLDDTGQVIADQWLEDERFEHNQPFLLSFPAQPHSAGRGYRLRLSGDENNHLSAWGYSLDVLEQGELAVEGQIQTTGVRDLRFETRYQLTWPAALRHLAAVAWRQGLFLLLALVFMPLPGVLLLLVGPGSWRHWDVAAWWATALGLGLAVWPLLWFAVTLAGGRWHSWSLWLALVGGWLLAVLLWRRGRRHRRREPRPRPRWSRPHWSGHHSALVIVLLLGLALRLLAVRDLAFPPWVDASRHALITALMAARGQVPTSYVPFLDVAQFPYHFGFHALAASLYLLARWPLTELLLFLGQLLNALIPLSMYAAVWFVARRPATALLAAFLTAVPFFFPAYYATWGRLTQLTALLLLPLLLALTWQLLRGSRAWRHVWWLVAVLAAGLFLIHLRVFIYYLPYAALAALASRGRHWRWLAASAGLALLLLVPRFWQLLRLGNPVASARAVIPNYNVFPTAYLNAGWERLFALLAALALLFVLLAAARRRAWAFFPLALSLWAALVLLLLAGDRIGLPQTTLVNLNSFYIILFIPLALLLAISAERLWRVAGRLHWRLRPALAFPSGIALALLLLFGARQQITILNPQTLLASAEDAAAIAWLAQNVPESATVAVNSWRWLGDAWAGGDGGAWLLPLTGRATTTPPVDYAYSADLFRQVAAFNEAALAVEDWSDPAAAAWLRDQGVSHLFVGHRGGFFEPAALARNPRLELLYSHDGALIFAVKAPAG